MDIINELLNAGFARVIVLEPNAQRAAFAKTLGADAVVDPLAEDPVAAYRRCVAEFCD